MHYMNRWERIMSARNSKESRMRRAKLLTKSPFCWFCGVEVRDHAEFRDANTRAILYQIVSHRSRKEGIPAQERVLICHLCSQNLSRWRTHIRRNQIEGWEPTESEVRGKNNVKRRRLYLLREDPHCWYCGVLVEEINWDSGSPPSNAATLEHLTSSFLISRGAPREGDGYSVLACYECNMARGRWEELLMGREELQQRAGSWPCYCSCEDCFEDRHSCQEPLCNRTRMSRAERRAFFAQHAVS